MKMNEEHILEDLREHLRYINERLSHTYCNLEEDQAEISNLEDQRRDTIIVILKNIKKKLKKKKIRKNKKTLIS